MKRFVLIMLAIGSLFLLSQRNKQKTVPVNCNWRQTPEGFCQCWCQVGKRPDGTPVMQWVNSSRCEPQQNCKVQEPGEQQPE